MSDTPDKNPASSWQVWAAGIIAFLTKLVDEAWIQAHPEAVLWIGYAIAALILALRIKTRVPLRWRKVKPDPLDQPYIGEERNGVVWDGMRWKVKP